MLCLRVSRRKRSGKTCFHLMGRLGLPDRRKLSQEIESQWAEHSELLLDLSEVQEFDLSGLSWLMRAEDFMRHRGGRLRIVAASRSVQRAMVLLNPATHTLFCQDSPGLD